MAVNPLGPSGPPCVMGHGHDHGHGSSQAGSAFRWSIALNSGLTVLQLLIGFGFGSVSYTHLTLPTKA